MRADRLLRVLFALQSREVVTASELADELEVSLATARRDLEALAMSGVPVYPQRGRGGGWRLVGGARTNLTGLTESESLALAALLGDVDGAPRDVADVVRKLLQALPATFREGARRVASSSAVDGAWGDRAEEERAVSDALATARLAIARSLRVRVAYRDREPFDASPIGIGTRGGHDYLLVDRDGEQRMLRLDRVRALEALDEPAARTTPFSEAWARAVERVERLRGSASATALVDPRALGPIATAFGAQLDVGGTGEDGRVEVAVRAQSVEALAEQLAGWSAVVEVTGPPDVRTALAALGARLVAAYGTRST